MVKEYMKVHYLFVVQWEKLVFSIIVYISSSNSTNPLTYIQMLPICTPTQRPKTQCIDLQHAVFCIIMWNSCVSSWTNIKTDNPLFLLAQIQNEFIQQGCLNFRLVPVLFPNATKVSTSNTQWLTDIKCLVYPNHNNMYLFWGIHLWRFIVI